jgi:hypothetical protein
MNLGRGDALALAGAALFVVTMAVGAGTAPDLVRAGDGERATLVGIQGGGTGWHEHGAVSRYEGTDRVWQVQTADSYFDVTASENGTVLAGFMDGGREACGPYESPCTVTGFHRLDPGADDPVVEEYAFPVRTAKGSETHDVEPLGDGQYLLSDMEHERLFVVDRDADDAVVWTWNASSFYTAPDDPTTRDWLHINDVDVIDEGRYLVSVRNANQLLIVERGAGVVEVINEDDDDGDDGSCGDLVGEQVRCGDPEVLDHQHNPQWLGEGAVLVADSDNDRVVELHRTDGGDWEVAWELSAAGGESLSWPRDADRLPNGNTLVTDTLNQRIIEVNRSGDVAWGIQTRYIPYEAERVPPGETVGASVYDGEGPSPGGSSDDVPVLSLALVGIRSVWTGLPFWFGELELGVTLVSVVMVGGGLVDRRRNGGDGTDGGSPADTAGADDGPGDAAGAGAASEAADETTAPDEDD